MHHTEPKAHSHHSESRGGGSRDVVSAVSSLVSSMSGAVDTFVRSVGPAVPMAGRRRHRRPTHDQCCESEPCRGCDQGNCHCDCCIGDVDLVVYARVGESRVVPIRVENTRARERTISVELGEFRTKGGKEAPVTGRLVGETAFTLDRCDSRDVVMTVRVGADRTDDVDRSSIDREITNDRETRRLPDVDDCLVAIADLRVEGCDMRPVRVAVAVLPRDCGNYKIECGCGCC